VIISAYSGTWPTADAHAALAHAVRASEIEFERVGARRFGAAHHVVPRLALRFDHQRCDHQVVRVALLHVVDFPEVHFDGPVADQLNIVEAHHFYVVEIDGPVARARVDDGVADCFPHHAAPACVEGAHWQCESAIYTATGKNCSKKKNAQKAVPASWR
jgi:hypothetical protein